MPIEGFSKFFTFEELTDSKKHPELVLANREYAKHYLLAGKRLSKLLESIRHILGDKPLTINSGCRDDALNLAVGSKAKNSKHKLFEAVDIVPSNMTIQQAFDKLQKAYKEGLLPDLRKVLQEGSWLHVEVSMSVNDYRGFFVSYDHNETFTKVG